MEKAKLEQELSELQKQAAVVDGQSSMVAELEGQLAAAQESLIEVEKRIQERAEMEIARNEARERQAALKAENESLRREMDDLKSRIDALKVADGAECPLCGQPLSESHRKSTLKDLEKNGKDKGDAFRANKKTVEDSEKEIAEFEAKLKQYTGAEKERLTYSNSISQLTLQLDSIQSQNKEWEKTGAKRLKEIEKLLESEKFANDAHKALKADPILYMSPAGARLPVRLAPCQTGPPDRGE